jgi:hypothetical protein
MFRLQSLLYRNQLSEQGRRKQCEEAGAAISKGHLLLSHHFSGQQYLLKLYCMDTRLLLAIMDRKIKSVNRRILLDLALIYYNWLKIKQRLLKDAVQSDLRTVCEQRSPLFIIQAVYLGFYFILCSCKA